ncbi:uncharacterized protein MONBRDRAFT_37745 [Monosiga brevicollis MX1]|uniref:Superoxide dismutase copper/zinc binding domain-containing protein n=1 Tax=Monosiga brevicollis TaxID=81824 RepID=A9V3S8_MONBE|nr:uncharacterized protein MONBRDRAFT_37745 [Monosiga brevicollis MX1]EDQ87759.1 predicted protein [Monosiga brevicollis MX1]|eukprot:XP_001747292.1 hypothetical protein [Monosiga brevicollis MX1]
MASLWQQYKNVSPRMRIAFGVDQTMSTMGPMNGITASASIDAGDSAGASASLVFTGQLPSPGSVRLYVATYPRQSTSQSQLEACSLDQIGELYDPQNLRANPNYATRCSADPSNCAPGDLEGIFGKLTDCSSSLCRHGQAKTAPRDLVALTGRALVLVNIATNQPLYCSNLVIKTQGVSNSALQGKAHNKLLRTSFMARQSRFEDNILSRFTLRFGSPNPANLPTTTAHWLLADRPATSTLASFCAAASTPAISINLTQTCNGPLDLQSTSGVAHCVTTLAEDLATLSNPVLLLSNTKGGSPLLCSPLHAPKSRVVHALFNTELVDGVIQFSQPDPDSATTISVTLKGLHQRAGGWHVHTFPVPEPSAVGASPGVDQCSGAAVGGHFNPFNALVPCSSAPGMTDDQCEVGDLAGKHGTLANLDSVSITYTDWNLPLFGAASIVGRSIVIHVNANNNPRLACATIQPEPDSVTTVVARFMGDVVGDITFQQDAADPYADTTVLVDLRYTNQSQSATSGHNWHVHVDAPDLLNCASAGGHYNPLDVCLTAACGYPSTCGVGRLQPGCEMGDLANKHGPLNILSGATLPGARAFFTDLQLPLSGPDSIIGRSIVVHGADGAGARLTCATLRRRAPRTATATVAMGGISGTVGFAQAYPGAPTYVTVNLAGLQQRIGGYHVHVLPVPAPSEVGLSSPSAAQCSPAAVGGHFDPYNTGNTCDPSITGDACEVGDLSGKHGSLRGLTSIDVGYSDMHLPLFGVNSIVGRSVVLHSTAQGAPRLACATIQYADTHSVLTYKAHFTSTGSASAVTGSIVFQQLRDDPDAETSVLVALAHSAHSSGVSMGHAWHVHQSPVSGSDCASAGGHYNPYEVCLSADCGYSSSCGQSGLQAGCELGDLAHKHGTLSLGAASPLPLSRSFYTDIQLPLSGATSVGARSIVIHGSNGTAPRIACASMVASISSTSTAAPTSTPASSSKHKHRRTAVALLVTALFLVAGAMAGMAYYRHTQRHTRGIGSDMTEQLLMDSEYAALEEMHKDDDTFDLNRASQA